MISLDFLFARSPLAEDCFISHLAESKRTTREALTKILILLRLHLPRRKFAVCVCQMEQKTKRNPPNAKRNIWVLFFFVSVLLFQNALSKKRRHEARSAKFFFWFFCLSSHLAEGAGTRREAQIFCCFSFSFSDHT